MKYCKKCNKYFSEDASFCPECGDKLIEMGNEEQEIEEKTNNSMYQTLPKEKITLSRQFLIIKLIIIGLIEIYMLINFFDVGITSWLFMDTWEPLVGYLISMVLFDLWFRYNLINYAGNQYLCTFGISREIFKKAELVLKIVEKIVGIIVAIIFCICYLKQSGDTGLISLYTILYAILESKRWLVFAEIVRLIRQLTMVYRPVSQKELSDNDDD